MAVFAPCIAPYPDQGRGESNLKERFQAPSAKHLMGTDREGRDILSRVIYGARIPLYISFAVTAAIVIIGVPLGGIAGYYGGKVDEVVMRVTDVFLAFPSLILAIAFVAFLGPSIRNVMIAIVVSWWPWYTRLVRGMAVSLRQRPYVEAAKTMGVRNPTIICRHILPNAFGPVIVQMTLDIGTVILAAAGLSFIGLGAQPPDRRVGPHGRRGPGVHPAAVVDRHLPRPGHLHPRARLQPRRRRPARRARPEVEAMSSARHRRVPAARCANELLTVRDLSCSSAACAGW